MEIVFNRRESARTTSQLAAYQRMIGIIRSIGVGKYDRRKNAQTQGIARSLTLLSQRQGKTTTAPVVLISTVDA